MTGEGIQQLLQNSSANLASVAERSFLNLENSVLKNELAYDFSAMASLSLDFLFFPQTESANSSYCHYSSIILHVDHFHLTKIEVLFSWVCKHMTIILNFIFYFLNDSVLILYTERTIGTIKELQSFS